MLADEVLFSLQARFRERASWQPTKAEAQRRYFKELIEPAYRTCLPDRQAGRSETLRVERPIQTYGLSVPAKTPIAQVNEVLLKCLCHNICVLISSIYELDLAPTFWHNRAS